jgi:hypothetical protein
MKIETITFSGTIRYWDTARGRGLSVVDVPAERVADFGGLKQQRVAGTIGGAAFTSSVMPAGGGRLALSVSKAMMSAGRVAVGEDVVFTVTDIGRD